MNRQSFPSTPILLRASALLLACAFALSFAPPAEAGFGDLVKKAKDKATGKNDAKADEGKARVPDNVDEIVFDTAVLELTDQRLGKCISAFKKAGGASEARTELVAKIEAAETARNNFMDKNEEPIRKTREKRDDVEGCRQHGYRLAEERRAQEYAQRALTDPALIAKFSKIAQEDNAAAARGDSAAINRMNSAIIAEMVPTREDTVSVQRKCGAIPPPSSAEGTLAKLESDIASTNENLRSYDNKMAKDQAQESGMNPEQYGIAWERIRNYCAWRGNKKQTSMRGYSDAEVAALEKRLAEVCAK